MIKQNLLIFSILWHWLLTAIANPVVAQTSAVTDIQEMTITSNRLEQSFVEFPGAVSQVTQSDIQIGRQQLGLDESLARVPGLFMQNRYNFAQDLRIAIRGFGARSAFGIRGIQIIVDDIPASLPDGQSGVDSIDIGSIESIEVLRGSGAAVYGAAAGGVINIRTELPDNNDFFEVRQSVGDYGFNRSQLKLGGHTSDLNYLFSLSRTEIDGYREHGETSNKLLNSHLRYSFNETGSLSATINIVDSPHANDPGGINAAQAEANPESARDANILFDSGEAIQQKKLGLVYRNELANGHDVLLRGYAVDRSFENRLPFTSGGAVNLERTYLGLGAQYILSEELFGGENIFRVGTDFNNQADSRKRFDNLNGIQGSLTLDQQEDVSSYGVYLSNDFHLKQRILLSAGLRYDKVKFDVTDRLPANGDNPLTADGSLLADGSGKIEFSEWSPSLSILWHLDKNNSIYARYATSFETPTTTELANPDGSGGFNPNLEAQLSKSQEIGFKGFWGQRFFYEASLFNIDIKDELVPFELEAFPNRNFYRNAGSSIRKGLELSLTAEPIDQLRTVVAYTKSSFNYDDFVTDSGDFSGNNTPGIPDQVFFAEISYFFNAGTYMKWELQKVAEIFLNDMNSEVSDDYSVSNLSLNHDLQKNNWDLSLFGGLNNLFNERYSSNLRINAFGGRYYEPAPERNFYLGFKLRYNR